MVVRDEPRDHVAQFYEHDAELVTPVSGFLAAALRAGDVAIVVATPRHVSAIELELVRSGVDPVAARAKGNLITLDAAGSLARLLVDGAVDGDAFDAVFGALIRQAVSGGRAVRVFGEMVDLLWDLGQVDAVMALEALWNRLGNQVTFSLYCAYRAEPGARGHDHPGRTEICRLHSAVVGHVRRAAVPVRPTVAEAVQPFAMASSLAEVRRFVAETLQQWDHRDIVADASVVVTELAANAIRHARSPLVVALSQHPGVVRVAVHDASPDLPVGAPAPRLAAGGRGLRLVAALADRWGTEPSGDGKVVWAELAL